MASATAGIFGIGKGDAQVIGPNQGLAMLQRTIAQDERKRAAEDAQIQSQLSKVNFDGARNADTDYLFQGYNKLRQTNAQLRTTKDAVQRNKLLQDLQGQQQQLLSAVNLSKQANLGEQKYAQLRLDRHNELKDDYGQKYSDLIGTSIFDPSYKDKGVYFSDPFVPTFDMTSLAKKVQDRALNTSQGKAYTKQLAGGATQWGQDEITKLDENAAKSLLIQEIASQPNLRKNIMTQYGQKAETPEAATGMFINDFLGGLRAKNKIEFKQTGFQAPERPDKFYEHQAYLEKHKDTSASNPDDERDKFISALQGGNQTAFSTLEKTTKTLGGKYEVHKDGVMVTLPRFETKNKYEEVTNSDGKKEQQLTGTTKVKTDKKYFIPSKGTPTEQGNLVINELLNDTQDALFKTRPLYEKKSNPYGNAPQAKPASSSSTTTRVSSSSSGSMTTVQLPDGRTGQIPAGKVADFLKQYPKAKKL